MEREVIGPLKRVPLSQAVKAGGFVFVSGSIALRPGTTELVPGGIEEETRQTLDNISAVLGTAGSSMARVVKTTVYPLIRGFLRAQGWFGWGSRFQPFARAGMGWPCAVGVGMSGVLGLVFAARGQP